MQRQLQAYARSVAKRPQHGYLFSTQKSARFSAKTATQHVLALVEQHHTVADALG